MVKKSNKPVSKPLDLGSLFAEDEILSEVDPKLTADELLATDGVYAFSKVVDALNLDKKRLRDFAKKQDEAGIDVYEEYGLKKVEGSQWRVRMKNFREAYDFFRDNFFGGSGEDIQTIPKGISRERFFKLRGNYKLKAVLQTGYLPFDLREVTGILKKENATREKTGAWKGLKDWYVDFEPFVVWLYSRYQGVPVEKVRNNLKQ